MDKSLWKLIDFLKEMFINTIPLCKEEFFSSDRGLSSTTSAAGTIAMWLENDPIINKYNIISDDLTFVIIVLDSITKYPSKYSNIKFKNKEITNIIFSFIRKNIENGILDESKEIKNLSSCITSKPFDYISDMYEIAQQKDYYQSFKRLYTIKLEEGQPNPNCLYTLHLYDKNRMEELRRTHKKIKEHYFDKLETYTEEDVEIVINALEVWQKAECIEDIVRETLLSKINKRNTQKQQIEIKRIEREQKPILTKKQYHEIKNELDSKFDFVRMEPLINVTLTPEEIAHCIYLMNQLSFTDREKEIFLEKSFKKSREEIFNVDEILKILQEQIEFYNINDDIVKKLIENIEIFIIEYKEATDPLEKEEWLELIKSEIDKINMFIPKTFEYEKSMLLQKKTC